ncbi:hypothetical protein SELMODRAFT_448244 [Selaginella moellendorffii]|uniref:Uncharacterized protein n=1 Tax=Selaginella moellendorffii TaxID=88036 RepID=D8T5U5_SELML|nr:uncharacterized protein LOC9659996 [Selaginella moellendorffii]EFJ08028.1 hypothetical protein SELMODRAFT_448244 [Selaginella moellendorffii]|eukprot:XP_002990984.1 uncharacterized protein LOC9659996 [Selaginella moellendorffii]
MVSKILLLFSCIALVAMAEAATQDHGKDAAKLEDHGSKEAVKLEDHGSKEAAKVEDHGKQEVELDGSENNGGFTIQLQSGRHASKPEVWERIVKKDKARAHWIADRLEKASKEKQEHDG